MKTASNWTRVHGMTAAEMQFRIDRIPPEEEGDAPCWCINFGVEPGVTSLSLFFETEEEMDRALALIRVTIAAEEG